MSNRVKIKIRKKPILKPRKYPVTKHLYFNMFTKNGQNLQHIKAPYPMTLDEAQSHFDCLSIGIDD